MCYMHKAHTVDAYWWRYICPSERFISEPGGHISIKFDTGHLNQNLCDRFDFGWYRSYI
jgi:hypothetical protein